MLKGDLRAGSPARGNKVNTTILQQLQYPSGLFAAAKPLSNTGYHLSWIRDNLYALLGFEATGQYEIVVHTMHALLDLFKKHEYKIDWMIKQPEPKHHWRYIHARYEPLTGEEIHDNWGNKQNDAIGLFLFKIGQLETSGIKILRTAQDKQLIQKIVEYLAAIEYWHDNDNGIWEQAEDLHASSIGACVAGLEAVKNSVVVPEELIQKGRTALDRLLPNETPSRTTDLALLSLIYPLNIVSEQQRELILQRVETLVRERGVIRYSGDHYYKTDVGEAEWTLGLCWLAIIYKHQGILHKHAFYARKARDAMNENNELPELYYAGTKLYNDNCPLAWAQSLWVVANT